MKLENNGKIGLAEPVQAFFRKQGEVVIVIPQLSAVRPYQGGEDVQQCCLAGT